MKQTVMTYKKILVPHAGTPAGDKAVEHAINLAECSNGSIMILHVVKPLPIPSMLSSLERKKVKDSIHELQRSIFEEMQEKLSSYQSKIKDKKIRLESKVVIGIPEEEIERCVHEYKVDVVVMAKRRLSGIKTILKLGSTSRKVVEMLSCPIILIDGGNE